MTFNRPPSSSPSLRVLIGVALVSLMMLYFACHAHGQVTATFQGNTVFQGNTIIPANTAVPPPTPHSLWGLHEHAIGDSAAYPTIPFGIYRIWGTGCQWSNMWTGVGDTYNYSCLGQQIAYADTFKVPMIFTMGQVPSGLSTINPDNTNTTPANFPVAVNGVSVNCNVNCTIIVTTLQRLNAAVGDSVTLTGATTSPTIGGCPVNPNGTFTLTAVNNQTDYPWTYTFGIGAGTGNSSACGGNAITLADNNQTASRCAGINSGGWCYAPNDVAIDGTGTDAHMIAFLTGLLAYDAAHDPNHRLQYIEGWNEPQGAGYFNGSIAQTARMFRDMHTVIQASSQVTYMQLMSPAPSGGLTSPASYMSLFGADPSNPFQYACCINFHTYNFSSTSAATPDPMSAITTAANVRAAIAPFASALGKPFYASEGGWGQGPFAISTTNLGPNTGGVATGDKAGWIPDAYAAHLCAGISAYIYFAWDQRCHTGLACASTPGPYSIDPAGISYGLVHDWLVGNNIAQTCTKDGSNNWTLKVNRAGWNGTMLWNTGLTTVGSYTIPAGLYTDYRDIFGNVNPITPTQTTLPVQFDPILFETGPPPFRITTGTNLGTFTVGTAIPTTCLSATGNSGVVTWQEATGIGTSAQITPSGLAFNTSTGCLSGTPTTPGTYIPQIRAIDTSTAGFVYGTYALNFTFVVNSASSLTVTNGNPPGGTVGTSYGTFNFTATGGVPPYTWSIPHTGTVPTGLTIGASSISGIPTVPGTYTFTVQVTDSAAHTALGPAVGSYSVTISNSSSENQYCGAGDVWTGGTTDGPAHLPTACINTALSNTPQSSPPIPPVVTVAAGDLAGLKAAITAAQCGQTIRITTLAGIGVQAVYSGAGTGSPATLIQLPDLACPLNNWVYVETDQIAAAGFPAESVQATPCQINVASMPGRPVPYSCPSPAFLMPKIMVTNSSHVFGVDPACTVGVNCPKAWRFMGLDVTSQAGTNNQLALWAFNSGEDHIIVDRSLTHDGDSSTGLSTDDSHIGFAFDKGTSIAVINGWVYDEHCISLCVDSHAFDLGGVSPVAVGYDEGPFKVYGMHTESAGEVTQMGGGGNGVASIVPHDIEIRHNYNYKPTQWQQCFPAASGFGPCSTTKANVANPTYIGVKFIVKNCYDTKNSLRMLIEGNVCDGNWGQQSDEFGGHIVIGSKSQSSKLTGTANSDGSGNITWVSGSKFSTTSLSSLCATPGHCRFQFNSSSQPYPFLIQSVGPGGCTNNCTTMIVSPAAPLGTGQSFIACQPGLNPQSEVYEGVIRYNIFRNASRIGGITSGQSDCGDTALGTRDWSFHDNVGDGLDGFKWNLTAGACCAWSTAVHIANVNPSGEDLQNVSIFHNTIITYLSGGSVGTGPSLGFTDGPTTGASLIPNFLVYSNLGVSGWAEGNKNLCSTTGLSQDALFQCAAATFCFDNNFMATNTTPAGDSGAAVNNTPYSTTNNNACPHALSGNTTVTNYNTFQFVNFNNGLNGDYHLSLTSPYRGLAYDGTDPGANIDAVNSATQGVQ